MQAICSPFGTVRGDQAGRQLAHADLVAAVADAEPDPGAAVNRSSSGAVQGETSTPRMLRGRPSGLRPQRSMATAWLTPALAPRRRDPLDARAILDADLVDRDVDAGLVDRRAHRVGAGRIDGDAHRHAAGAERGRQQRGADRAVGLGRRHVVARHEEAGDEADAGGVGQRAAPQPRARRGSPRSGPGCRDRHRGRPALRWRSSALLFLWRHTLRSSPAANRRSARRPARASSRSSPAASQAPVPRQRTPR